MPKLEKCPECNGFGIVPVFLKPVVILCQMCKGVGKVADKKLKWRIIGREMRKYRVEVLQISLREASRRFNIDAANLSNYERGIINPKAVYGSIIAPEGA